MDATLLKATIRTEITDRVERVIEEDRAMERKPTTLNNKLSVGYLRSWMLSSLKQYAGLVRELGLKYPAVVKEELHNFMLTQGYVLYKTGKRSPAFYDRPELIAVR